MLTTNKFYPTGKKTSYLRPLWWAIYGTVVVYLAKSNMLQLNMPLTVASILGTAISLFLGFRTNSAYQRWWEARKVWGEIVNESRNLSRQIMCYGSESEVEMRTRILRRHIAWCWALTSHLRKTPQEEALRTYLVPQDYDRLVQKENQVNDLLLLQESDAKALLVNKSIDDFYYRKISSTLQRLCNAQGKCERIKNTVFPTQYALFTLVFINLFLLVLPWCLVGALGYTAVVVHVSVGFTFGMIQNIAESIQDPFENAANDIPISALSRTIERDILESMGEVSLPDRIQDENDILM